MTPDQRERMPEIFAQALERQPEQRAAFLLEACEGDTAWMAEIESLIAHDEQARVGFMRPPEFHLQSHQGGAPEGPDPRVGTSIGGYRIKSVIASGGMGTVYLAEQASPRRDVALKVMRTGLASRSALRRFEYESEILARLRHPHIAHVHEAGIHDDPVSGGTVPYFVMEYIPEARTITKYVAQERLTIRDRLELFTQVCEAVHHGHQKGIIHRDLKPGNILVDGTGHVKIIDFGVARSTDSDIAMTTLQTDVGQIIGTVQYMSPEQCEADPHELDTRSDVYALGVVLYELLCGQLPYDVTGRGLASAVRIISERPPMRPSTIDRRLRGDLEVIVLKALKKDREQRYQAAADLGRDIRHYLAHEPIEARSPTVWTRGVRWVTRHPVVAASVACFAVAALTIAATWISIWVLKTRPHSIVKYRSGQPVDASADRYADEARLFTLSGKELHTWGGTTCAIAFASLVECPAKFGGGKLALIGHGHSAADDLRGSLCAYDVDGDLEVPIWSRRIEDIPLKVCQDRGFVGKDFSVQRGRIADIFPDPHYPGNEVVVTFNNEFSQRIIRIYDLGGNLLYQVWHEGSLSQPYWISQPRLLVFRADNALVNWDGRGNLLRAERDPLVVFAIRPEPGYTHNTDFLNDSEVIPLDPGDDPGSPVWYRWVYKGDVPATREEITLWNLVLPIGSDPMQCVDLNVFVDKELEACVRWTIDESGNEVPGSRVPSDFYKIDQASSNPKLPDPDLFHFGPMPPIIASPPSSQKAPPLDPTES